MHTKKQNINYIVFNKKAIVLSLVLKKQITGQDIIFILSTVPLTSCPYLNYKTDIMIYVIKNISVVVSPKL